MRNGNRWMHAAWVLLAGLAASGGAVASDGVVGPGHCTEAGFSEVLATVDQSGGGTITFACNTTNTTITFANGVKTISNAVAIDGAGHITFDGNNNASAFFQVFAQAHVTLRRMTLQHGAQTGFHALENFGRLTLDRVRVANNSGAVAAVGNFGELIVRDSTFAGNVSTSDGGAIDNSSGTVDVSGSTFSANHAVNGAAIHSNGPLSVLNSTFNGNVASNGGGAIYETGSDAAIVQFATIVGNSGVFGAGLYNDAGGGSTSTLTIGASIVSANGDGNCDGVISSSGYNLSNGTGCGSAFNGPGDVINATLTMQALADNGGPTQTQAPATGNPAIDHVPLASCSVPYDQRGAGRPHGSGCDSGAFETGAAVERIFADGFD